MSFNYVGGIKFVTEECCNCGMPFAMTEDFQKRRLRDRETFHCPKGHPQHYVGKTEEQKLREQLERKAAENDRLQAKASAIAKNYSRMRKRVKNGVCPCCTRTFQNLMEHMRTQHPDFGKHSTVRALREAFGLTQTALAQEIGGGVTPQHISNYERERPVAYYAERGIEFWLAEQE